MALFGSGSDTDAMSDARPLEERLHLLQWLRLLVAALVIAISVVAPVPGSMGEVLLATGVYLALIVWAFVPIRFSPKLAGVLNGPLLLADGVFLAAVVLFTGGPGSPQAFLVYMQLIGVSLLLSYRTGVKLTVWHTLLLVATYSVVAAGYVEVDRSGFDRFWWLHALAFWAIAAVTAVFSSINESELRRGKGEMATLAKMGRKLEEADTVAAVSHVLSDTVATLYGFTKVTVALRAEENKWTMFSSQAFGETGSRIACDDVDPLIEVLWAKQSAVLVTAVTEARNPLLASIVGDGNHLALFSLMSDGAPIGFVLGEWGSGKKRVSGRVLDMIGQFCSHGALAIRNVTLMEEVNRMATTDGLTGLLNRREFDRHLSAEVARARRHGTVVSLVLFDIDHFKSVNDVHGHQAGDDVLRFAAKAFTETRREVDIACRYGGEEFAVIMPATDLASAKQGADRLRAAVAAYTARGPVPVTMSAGVAACPDSALDEKDIIAGADAALYQSKENGRDRATIFQPVTEALHSEATAPQAHS